MPLKYKEYDYIYYISYLYNSKFIKIPIND